MIPARTSAIRLIESCAAAPPSSCQSRKAPATATLAAAGMVVTEISTPIRAPDLAAVRESTPAVPARTAPSTEKRSGCEMNCVSGCSSLAKPSGTRSTALRRSATP